MKNRETILKYLSDLMDENEKKQFEERLHTDNELKNELEKIQKSINELGELDGPEIDSAYFNNLIPKFRAKLESNKRKKTIVLVPAVAFVATVLIIYFLQIPISERNKFELNISPEELTAIVSESDSFAIDELYETNFIEDYAYYNSSEGADELDLYLDDSFVSEFNLDEIESYYTNEQADDYGNFSNEQVDIIYEELLNKKIL